MLTTKEPDQKLPASLLVLPELYVVVIYLKLWVDSDCP